MSPRRRILAAPFVVTALASSTGACVYSNPAPPEQPSSQPTPSSTATTPAPTGAPTGGAPLSDIPKNGGGHVTKQADGTCLYVFPDPVDDCPPEVDCNPGPPRAPLHVKCPADGDKPSP